MGAFTAKPKAPKPSSQVVYYVPRDSKTTGSSSSTSSQTVSTVEADEKEVAATRVENVLRRRRGIVGNVLTSLRGVLENNSSAGIARKTLLGE
ncbi:MAG TPA: hypothetical protein PLK94_06210 [Alphaproteobacteria bacterium]|nr:hypothetical protein [Alphaproteobacteria bacterium]HOO50865.1 hypothetical protein [Alphaproteobacteria bacterium]